MDILGEYERQRQVASAPIRPTSFRPGSEYGFFIKLVMRLFGGKIENGRQASIVLLVAAAAILLISLFIFARASEWFSLGSPDISVPVAGPEDPGFRSQQQQ